MSLEDQRLIMKSDREVRKILTYDFFSFFIVELKSEAQLIYNDTFFTVFFVALYLLKLC